MNNNDFIISEEVELTTAMKCVKLSENTIIPTRGSDEAAGWDLYVPKNQIFSISPHSTQLISLDLSIALPKGTFGAIFARSGLSIKKGLKLANGVGVIDSDDRGNIGVALYNDTDQTQVVQGGDRIAQLIVVPYIPITFDEVESLDATNRGTGGFGSTGKN